MRPLRLEVEGFATFKERTVLDFSDLDLVALTGSTGAGKSTVIDAMTFALYGSVSRYGNAGVVEPVIHQLAAEAKVRFDFEVGGRRHVATRVTRRQNRSGSRGGNRRATTKEARLERFIDDNAGNETEILAGSVTELDAAVVSLLGLTFNQFTRTVVLPQGEFANFLRDEPIKRQELLKRLLDLEVFSRMGTEARKRAEAADQQIKTLEHELSRLAVVDDEQMAALERRRVEIADLRQQMEQGLSRLHEIDQVLSPLRAQASQMQTDIDALGAVSIPEGTQQQAEAVTGAEQSSKKAAAEAEKAHQLVDQARSRTIELGNRTELIERRQRLVQVEAATLRLEELATEHQAGSVKVTAASKTLTQADHDQKDLSRQLDSARLVGDAAHLIEGLVVGDSCPVCRQTVGHVPDQSSTAESEATANVGRLEGLLRAATTAVQRATAVEAAAKAELTSIESQQSEWSRRVDKDAADGPTTIGIAGLTVPDIDQALQLLDASGAEEQELAKAAKAADQALTVARAAVDDVRARQASGRQLFGRHRDSVSHLGPPEAAFESLHSDWLALAEWAAGHRSEIVAERSEVVDAGKRRRSEHDDVAQRLSTAANAAGVAVEPSALQRAPELISLAEADRRVEQQRALDAQTQAKRLADDIAERSQIREVNRELGRHLSARGFEAWLLAEALDDITARATTRLLELSSGRYSLASVDRDIVIIDHHNADEQRAARTLSGGETFLASLALALALADSIAELAPVDAPRLESMFLDEGFGTLDPDTLDVVAQAIEELAASGRMIGIVTHVRDLAERMPARFEIKKLPGGSTAELVTL